MSPQLPLLPLSRRALLRVILSSVALASTLGCQMNTPQGFADDLAFLERHTDVIRLGSEADGPAVAVVPQWQGRVMTSTPSASTGASFGWINYDLIKSGELKPHINAFGGEDRLWLGPEGGQFSIFFEPDVPFDLEHWQTPAAIDTVPYDVVEQSDNHVTFRHETRLTNYSKTVFDLRLERSVHLLSSQEIESHIGDVQGLNSVGYESRNHLTNVGTTPWTKETGLLSIWILGMLNPSPETVVFIPYRGGGEEHGPIVNDTYFGKVPAERLKVEDGFLVFSGDGQYRSKIGLSPSRSTPLMGSYDSANDVLTIVQFTFEMGVTDYVNSMWEIQDAPYGGDVINSYNDGPPEPGKAPLGPFYELESSSPAAALGPGETLSHVHRTLHIEGRREALAALTDRVFGLSLDRITTALISE